MIVLAQYTWLCMDSGHHELLPWTLRAKILKWVVHVKMPTPSYFLKACLLSVSITTLEAPQTNYLTIFFNIKQVVELVIAMPLDVLKKSCISTRAQNSKSNRLPPKYLSLWYLLQRANHNIFVRRRMWPKWWKHADSLSCSHCSRVHNSLYFSFYTTKNLLGVGHWKAWHIRVLD